MGRLSDRICMDEKQARNIDFFSRGIRTFFKLNGRKHLPWRKDGVGAYEVWVSEVMLQQTQVSRVIEYYERFLRRFPSVESLACAQWEEFLPFYRGLGYYRRGRNMISTAKRIVADHNGRFPRDIASLKTLPGVGEYTARAILSFAYRKDYLSWDTNFRRVFGRFFYGSKNAPIDTALFENRIRMNKRDFNAAVMDFGSMLCAARPKCDECPLSGRCVYNVQDGDIERAEKNARKRRSGEVSRVIVVLHNENRDFYSSRRRTYRPFRLPSGIVTRSGIKEYFLESHGLEVSVRPPYLRLDGEEGAILFVRAQILLGNPTFESFTKTQADAIMRGLENS